MLRQLGRIWNFDLAEARLDRHRWPHVLGLVVAVLGMGTLVVGSYGLVQPLLADTISGDVKLFGGALSATGACVVFACLALAVMASIGYSLWVPLFGPRRAEQIPVVWASALSMVVALAAGFLVTAIAGGVAVAIHGGSGSLTDDGAALLGGGIRAVDALVDHVPTLFRVPAALAALVYVVADTLGFYVLHRAMHTSRVLWLLFHRPHHVPTNLTAVLAPVATLAPVLFLFFPAAVLVFKVVLKLFPSDVSDTVVFAVAILQGTGDLAAHQTPLYARSYRNPVLRFFFALVSGGPYHYVHHSSRPEDHAVNLSSGAPFLVWDRVFGSYRAPPAEIPRVGLTNDPRIRLSPFLIVFSGWQQLAYELRMNRDWRTRAKVLFGSVKYKPPVTRDYLILGYPGHDERTDSGAGDGAAADVERRPSPRAA